MKATVFASWIALLCTLPAYGQSCFPGGLTFISQQEVNAFKIMNPGCKVIEGDVSIYGGITNLNGLSNITAINGTLGIDDCDGLAGGLYFFKISDVQGRVFAGKIMIAD